MKVVESDIIRYDYENSDEIGRCISETLDMAKKGFFYYAEVDDRPDTVLLFTKEELPEDIKKGLYLLELDGEDDEGNDIENFLRNGGELVVGEYKFIK